VYQRARIVSTCPCTMYPGFIKNTSNFLVINDAKNTKKIFLNRIEAVLFSRKIPVTCRIIHCDPFIILYFTTL